MMKFYHATTKDRAEKIKKEGVIKSFSGGVFLCKNPADSCKFLAIRGIEEMTVIEVNLKVKEVKESFDRSQAFFQCKAYIHAGDIILRGNENIVDYKFEF